MAWKSFSRRETKRKGNFYSVPPTLFEQKLSISGKCVQEIERLMCPRVVSCVSFAALFRFLPRKSRELRMNSKLNIEVGLFTHIERSFNLGKTLILFISSFANNFCEFSFLPLLPNICCPSAGEKYCRRKKSHAKGECRRIFLEQSMLRACSSFFVLVSSIAEISFGWDWEKRIRK